MTGKVLINQEETGEAALLAGDESLEESTD
jgi:hypothetical protein